MAKQFDLLCVAGVCADLIFSRLPFIPKAGEESYAQDFVIKAGGGGNTPIAAAKLGLRTALGTLIGKDAMGDMLAKLFDQAGIAPSGIVRDGACATSISAVMSLNDGGERAFASYDRLDLRRIDLKLLEDLISQARHVHTYQGYCMALPILELAQKHGCTVSLDTSFNPDQTLEALLPHLQKTHIFLPNAQEACHLAGTDDPMRAAEVLAKHVPILIIKLGEKGAMLRTGEQTTLHDAISNVRAVDTTGAGDNFIAGFLYAYLKGLPLCDCMRWANASGALSVTFVGGVDESYTKENVEALL